MAKSEFRMEVDTEMLRRIIQQLPGEIDGLLAGAATEMVGDMQQGMLDSPADPSRVYVRGGVSHEASMPGNPPRPDTGSLYASLNHEKTGTNERTIFDQVEYGQYLEFGAEEVGLEARPWMRPVFEQWRRGAFNAFLRRVGGFNG